MQRVGFRASVAAGWAGGVRGRARASFRSWLLFFVVLLLYPFLLWVLGGGEGGAEVKCRTVRLPFVDSIAPPARPARVQGPTPLLRPTRAVVAGEPPAGRPTVHLPPAPLSLNGCLGHVRCRVRPSAPLSLPSAHQRLPALYHHCHHRRRDAAAAAAAVVDVAATATPTAARAAMVCHRHHWPAKCARVTTGETHRRPLYSTTPASPPQLRQHHARLRRQSRPRAAPATEARTMATHGGRGERGGGLRSEDGGREPTG